MSSDIKLELENIGVFRGKKELHFNKGLNIVYAPNASGKTSLIAGLKAVSVTSLSSGELARVLSDFEDKGRVKLTLNGEEYEVIITRLPDNSIKIDGKRVTEDGVIKRIAFLDMDSDLVNAIYSGEEERVEEVLKEISGLSFLETGISIIEGLKSSYEYSYERKKSEYESRKDEIERDRRRIEERLRAVRQKIEEMLRRSEVEPARKQIEEIEKERREILGELSELRREETELNAKKGSLEVKYRDLKAEYDYKRESREELEKEKREIEKKIVDIRKEIEKLQEEVRKLREKEKELLNEVREYEKSLERRKQVLGYAKCPYCGTDIDRNKLMEEISEIEDKILELKDKLNEIRVSIQERVAMIEDFKKEGEIRLEEINKELNKLDKEIASKEKELETIRREMREIERELEEVYEKMKKFEEKLGILEKKLEVFKDISPLIEELRKLQSEETHLSKQLDYTLGRLRQLDLLYQEVITLKERIEVCEFIAEYFQIRLDELKNLVVNEINKGILENFKLLSLAELEYPILSSDFSLTLTRVGGVPTSLAELSDAEKAILTILLTTTLKKYVAEEFPFYVVDTLIEFIDDSRAKEIIRYLRERSKDREILLITKTKPYSGELKLLSQEDIVTDAQVF